MKSLDENMIDDVIIRKRATLFKSGGAPKTYTRLYLYPALVEVAKSRNVNDLLNAYGYFMPIPVSPSHLEYKRESSHTEAYGIVSGGLLQRNLPKLWHLSIETYLPRDIYERAFHNWSQDREWSGEYTQQHFVDYINLIMQYKIPLAMYDSSSPQRIRHNCEYWCIDRFSYKMLPHDDIDYTLDLIEWREPHVKLSDVEMKNVTEPETPKVRRGGGGNAIMVFGDNDTRVFNKGEVYDARVKLAFVMKENNLTLGFDSYNALKTAVDRALDTNPIEYDYGSWKGYLHYNEATASDGEIRVPYYFESNNTLEQIRNIVRQSIMNVLQHEVERRFVKGMKAQGCWTIKEEVLLIGARPFGGLPKAYPETPGAQNPIAAQAFKLLNDGQEWSKRRNLHMNAWCKLNEIRRNVPLYTTSMKAGVTNSRKTDSKTIEEGVITLSVKKNGVWFEEMYVVTPIEGTRSWTGETKDSTLKGDLFYSPRQSWLVPKQNTIRTSYKKYLGTIIINNGVQKTTYENTTASILPDEVIPNKENHLEVQTTEIKATNDGWKTETKEYNNQPDRAIVPTLTE